MPFNRTLKGYPAVLDPDLLVRDADMALEFSYDVTCDLRIRPFDGHFDLKIVGGNRFHAIDSLYGPFGSILFQ